MTYFLGGDSIKSKLERAKSRYDQARDERIKTLNKKKDCEKRLEDAENNRPYPAELQNASAVIAEYEDAKADLEKIQKECDELSKKLKELNDNKPRYDQKDIDAMDSIVLPKRNGDSLAALRNGKRKTSNDKAIDNAALFDLRNVNNKNFRGYGKGVMNAALDNGLEIGPSRIFYMNQQYLFSNSLDKANYDIHKMKSMPEIQPLILNEFQPYDMLTVADFLKRCSRWCSSSGRHINTGGGRKCDTNYGQCID